MFGADAAVAIAIPILAIVGWSIYAIVAVVMRARIRELEVRERIAMIEKGLLPPPEVDPSRFERAMSGPASISGHAQYRAYKQRSAGVAMIALGLGLIVMMYPNFRVGGFLCVVGLGFIVSGMLERPAAPPRL